MRVECLAAGFFFAKAARSVQKRRPVRGIIWSGLAYLMTKNLYRGMNSWSAIIHGMYLHEDGLKVDLTF